MSLGKQHLALCYDNKVKLLQICENFLLRKAKMIVFPPGQIIQSFDFVDKTSIWVAVSNVGEVRFGSLADL